MSTRKTIFENFSSSKSYALKFKQFLRREVDKMRSFLDVLLKRNNTGIKTKAPSKNQPKLSFQSNTQFFFGINGT